MGTTTPATRQVFQMGEGPVWDADRGRLLWVDITAGEVLEGALDGHAVEVTGRSAFGSMVGTVAVAADGTLLVAAQEQLLVMHPDGTLWRGPRIVPAGAARRCNDGATDPAGRFLVGTLSLTEPTGAEVLMRLEDDATTTRLDDDLRLSNGLAWSTDGTRMFNVDTLRHVVFVRDYDAATGAVGPRRIHLRLDDGLPDGIAMDAEEHLWIAVWGGGQARRHAPDGAVVDVVDVPAPHTSSVAFAGADLRTLVITTARAELTDAQLRDFPDSGRLFTTPVDVPGAPVPAWNGAALAAMTPT